MEGRKSSIVRFQLRVSFSLRDHQAIWRTEAPEFHVQIENKAISTRPNGPVWKKNSSSETEYREGHSLGQILLTVLQTIYVGIITGDEDENFGFLIKESVQVSVNIIFAQIYKNRKQNSTKKNPFNYSFQ